MRRFQKILMCIFAAIFLFSAWKVFTLGKEYLDSRSSYAELSQYVSLQPKPTKATPSEETQEEAQDEQGTGEDTAEETVAPEAEPLWPAVDFEALKTINPDIVGWIYIPDTEINYPVVFRDNLYYMDRLFDGTPNPGGCIFLEEDCTADFADAHSILYGHHMKDGSMFAGISKYRTQEYFEEHPIGMLLTPEGDYQIEFFSGYVAGTYENAWQIGFGEGEFDGWLAGITKRSLFRAEVAPSAGDRILTLSTCSYEFEDARFVLHGVLIG